MKKILTLCLIAFVGMQVVNAEQFYLDITGSTPWQSAIGTSGDTEAKATFKNAGNPTGETVTFTVTAGNQYVYEVTVPAGSWDKVSIDRYFTSSGVALGGDQTKEYAYDGLLNCATVTDWFPDAALTTYTPPAASESITIRFKKPVSWSAVYIHAWDGGGAPLAGFAWPGNLMTADGSNPGWYYYTFDASVTIFSFQFNDGTGDNLIVSSLTESVTESTSYNEDGTIYTPVSSEGITIRFNKPVSWSAAYIHAWDGGGAPLAGFAWPGNLMTADGSNPGWYYYTFDASVTTFSFQFNDGTATNVIVSSLTENITESTSYNEDGSIFNQGTSVQSANVESSVYAKDNQLIASFEGAAQIQLFAVTGQQLYAGTASGEFVYPVASGIYLLQINGETYKVLVP